MKRDDSARRHVVVGLAWIGLAAVTLALADGLVKWLSGMLSVWQLVLLRSLIALPLIGLWHGVTKKTPTPPRAPCWLALRSLLLVVMWILVYLALAGLPLPTVSAAFYTSPLLITLFCGLAPGRRLRRGEIIAVLIGLAGVLVLLRPGSAAFSMWLWLPLTAAGLYAAAALITATHCRDESPLVLALGLQVAFLIVATVALVGLSVVSLPPAWAEGAPFVATGWHPLTCLDMPFVAGLIGLLAVIAVVASAAMGRAYQVAPAPVVAAGDYSYLVFSVFWSFMLFGHLPDVWGYAGILLIVVGGLYASRQGHDADLPRHGER